MMILTEINYYFFFLKIKVEAIRNLFAALFLASIGMLIHVKFLWNHVDILLASVILVIIIKSLVVTIVVKAFNYSIRTAFVVSISNTNFCLDMSWFINIKVSLILLLYSVLQVGLSLAQIGEFAFVLLSRASHLNLVEVIISSSAHFFLLPFQYLINIFVAYLGP